MRRMVAIMAAVIVGLPTPMACADDESKRLIGGVVSGLLGQPAPQDAAYVAQERERLVFMLQQGDYVTSRQGETVDVMVLGVPLTHRDHVYTARPIPPSSSARSSP